ncbi:MAG: transcriptional regulator [Betaproteobacteria bacterium RBG_16_58_11]|nr:MAG: transcriptional regulator [Betaproteobacteria bacterium RBG_16_58_11]
MSKSPPVQTVFGRRLREARLRADIAQDRLGVKIGLDEGCSSARMSRYETGVHEPPFPLAVKIAKALGVPAAYFYCNDDRLAEIMLIYTALADSQRKTLLEAAINLRNNTSRED